MGGALKGTHASQRSYWQSQLPGPVRRGLAFDDPTAEDEEEDEDYYTDEDGVEWWKDDDGYWWYREPGQDDWQPHD